MGIKDIIVRKSEDQAHAQAVLLMARTVHAWQQAFTEIYLISWDLEDTLALIYLVGRGVRWDEPTQIASRRI